MKNNHPIPNNHFKKTAKRYRTTFHLPARALKRKETREKNASKLYPAPLKTLKPIVRCPTLRHNRKERLGRGFTPEECQAAGISYLEAPLKRISVDLRRRNQNRETFDQNVLRLKTYLSKVVVFGSKKEARDSKMKQHTKIIMPIVRKKPVVEAIKISDIDSKLWAFDKIQELKAEAKK